MSKIKKWLPLFNTQFLGVLNDNLLKNLIVFISAFWVADNHKEMVISIATALLVVPFLFFSPLAGRLSQQYAKVKIVTISKFGEIPIMMISVIGFYLENIYLVMISLFLMGLQSAIYSPSKYGLIRDIGGTKGLSFGTGTMELLTFIAVLLGTFLAGIISDLTSYKSLVLSILLIFFAIVGWWASKRIKVKEQPVSREKLESAVPLKFIVDSYKWARSVKGLNYTILGLGCFWLIASLLQMNIILHLPDPEIYNFSNTATSLVMAGVAVGIGLGCWIAGLISKNRVEVGMVPIGGIGMSICITILGFIKLPAFLFVVILILTAFFSGFYKVPLNAWIQERVEGRKLGQILAYNNNVLFIFILLSAGIFALITNYFDSYAVFRITSGIAWFTTIVTILNVPAMMVRFIFYVAANLIYKVKINGQENLPKKNGALLIANHVSLMDAFLIAASVPRNVRFIMLKEVYDHWLFHWWFKRLNMIPIPSDRNGVSMEAFNKICQGEINKGHIVCIFPEGQISRIGHLLGFKKGLEHIAKGIEAPIIPMHIDGLAGTSLTYRHDSGKLIKPGFRLRKNVAFINIGKPQKNDSTAFQIRQKVQELQSENFKKRISHGPDLIKIIIDNYEQNIPLIAGEKASLTFGKCFNIADYLQKRHSHMKEVLLKVSDTRDGIYWNLGALIAGKVPINIPEKLNDISRWLETQDLSAPMIVTDEENLIPKKDGIELILSDQVKTNGIHNRKFDLRNFKRIKTTSDATRIIEMLDDDSFKTWRLSHENILANLVGTKEVFTLPKDTKLLNLMPIESAWGFTLGLCNALYHKFQMILDHEEDTETWAKFTKLEKSAIILASHEKIEAMYHTTPSIFSSNIKMILTGSTPVEKATAEILKNDHGIQLLESLGCTACAPLIAVNTPDLYTQDVKGDALYQKGKKTKTVGRPLPGVAVKVSKLHDAEHDFHDEETGYLWVKGAVLSPSADGHDAWFNTGILGSIDTEGFITIRPSVGIKKDLEVPA
ncbi:MFS transporter [Fulvivirgaceae bacterium BMA10]|uniref:MFS transporter n=1 Tax=Splendidivirga corallicola TaxID=3051826 RepID=A0ABT8KGC2_9BACT|nr:MFS transporter [Fulvivirgaceae bacterium BMA10]